MSVNRTYIATGYLHAPFKYAVLQGLGAVDRQYMETAIFRAPYVTGYYQDNTLLGLGADASADDINRYAPPAVQQYLKTGAPMRTWPRDLGTALNQVPPWGYAAIGGVLLFGAYVGYKNWKKTRSSGG